MTRRMRFDRGYRGLAQHFASWEHDILRDHAETASFEEFRHRFLTRGLVRHWFRYCGYGETLTSGLRTEDLLGGAWNPKDWFDMVFSATIRSSVAIDLSSKLCQPEGLEWQKKADSLLALRDELCDEFSRDVLSAKSAWEKTGALQRTVLRLRKLAAENDMPLNVDHILIRNTMDMMLLRETIQEIRHDPRPVLSKKAWTKAEEKLSVSVPLLVDKHKLLLAPRQAHAVIKKTIADTGIKEATKKWNCGHVERSEYPDLHSARTGFLRTANTGDRLIHSFLLGSGLMPGSFPWLHWKLGLMNIPENTTGKNGGAQRFTTENGKCSLVTIGNMHVPRWLLAARYVLSATAKTFSIAALRDILTFSEHAPKHPAARKILKEHVVDMRNMMLERIKHDRSWFLIYGKKFSRSMCRRALRVNPILLYGFHGAPIKGFANEIKANPKRKPVVCANEIDEAFGFERAQSLRDILAVVGWDDNEAEVILRRLQKEWDAAHAVDDHQGPPGTNSILEEIFPLTPTA